MFPLLLRKLWIRRRRSGADKTSDSTATLHELESQETKPHVPELAMTTVSRDGETDMIVDQLATLTTTVSYTSSGIISLHVSTPAHTTEPQSQTPKPLAEESEEEESFYHLRSLITISCLPQHKPGHTPAPSTSTLDSRAGRKSQIFDRKSASSILSLHLGDLPTLPFPSKKKSSCKPCPRYTILPPPFVQKRLVMRPEVRF